MNRSEDVRRFDRGAWVHLVLMSALLIVATMTTIYRFSLPTDGWLSVEPDGFDSYGYVYQTNVMGTPSGLQPGDRLLAVEGLSLGSESVSALWPLHGNWQAGNTMRYTVQRGDQELDFDVRLVTWDLETYARSKWKSVSNLVGLAGVFVFFVVGLLAFWRSPSNPSARALFVLAGAILMPLTAIDLLPTSITDRANPVADLSLTLLVGATFTVLLPPAFIRFALVFPKPSPLVQRLPWIALVPFAVGLVALVAFVLQFFVFTWAWTAASVVIAVLILVYNAVISRDAVSRVQLRWGLGSMVVGLGLFFLGTYPAIFIKVPDGAEAILQAVSALSFGIMGIGLGIAVMRYRLFDIDVIIRRTTSYAILTGVLLLVYFGSIVILQRLLSPITGDSDAAVVLSTLLIAALFLPLRRRVQSAIDRRFFRSKYDAEKVLEQFAATVRDETDLDALTAELVRVIQDTMQPEFVSVWLMESEKQIRPVATDTPIITHVMTS